MGAVDILQGGEFSWLRRRWQVLFSLCAPLGQLSTPLGQLSAILTGYLGGRRICCLGGGRMSCCSCRLGVRRERFLVVVMV